MTMNSGTDRRGWTLVCGLLLVMTICHGTISSGLPTLDKALLADLGISRGDLKLRETIFLMSSGLAGLGIGILTRHIAPRRIVIAGLLLMSATLYAYSKAATIGQIYALYVLFGLCFASSHVVIIVLLIRERFETRRAFATSVALSGTSIGASLFPPLMVLAQEHMDWRHLLASLSIVPLLILPVAAFLIRPPRGAADPTAEVLVAPVSMASTPRSRLGVILLIVATFGTFFGSTAFLLNLFLHLQDIGLSPRTAAAGMTVVFTLGLVGKVAVGAAAERWGVQTVWSTQHVLLLGGAILLTISKPAFAWPGLVLLGLGWAGCYVLTQVVIADFFAGPKLGQLTGWFIVLEAIGSGSGVWLAGVFYDHFGSYKPAFMLCCALIVVALVAGLFFRREAMALKRAALV
ncbi:CynX/NimT family MFS transporter [Sphingomonas montanisoli]|nr:MFS transporter [Sphingomonas montanisoli]